MYKISSEKTNDDVVVATKFPKPVEFQNICTNADFIELQRSYQFVLSSQSHSSTVEHPKKLLTKWQDRMVQSYHSHLFKEYVIADMSRYNKANNQIGLRWRMKQEVVDGKGFKTCGNKHCPSYYYSLENNEMNSSHTIGSNKIPISDVIDQTKKKVHIHKDAVTSYFNSLSSNSSNSCEEETSNGTTIIDKKSKDETLLLRNIPHGIGLFDYEVHFAYAEHGVQKSELVKLRLCLRCAPKLFFNRGGALKAREARGKALQGNGIESKLEKENNEMKENTNDFNEDERVENNKQIQRRDLSDESSAQDEDESSVSTNSSEYKKRKKKRRKKEYIKSRHQKRRRKHKRVKDRNR